MGNKLDAETLDQLAKETGLERAAINASFKDFQKATGGKSATLGLNEFISFCRSAQKSSAGALIRQANGSGQVDFREFLFLSLVPTLTPEEKIKAVFDLYDVDGSCFLERTEFEKLVTVLSPSFSLFIEL